MNQISMVCSFLASSPDSIFEMANTFYYLITTYLPCPNTATHRDRKYIRAGVTENDCLLGMGFPFGVIKRCWN